MFRFWVTTFHVSCSHLAILAVSIFYTFPKNIKIPVSIDVFMAKLRWDMKLAEAWKNFPQPIRPCESELKIINKYLNEIIKKKGKNTRILILGSTPEFRDLAHSRKLPAYVVDYSEDNHRALTLLKKFKGKEVLFRQDWRKLKLKEKYDLVLAEASLNMVKKNEMPVVLRNVNRVLAEDGLFIAKTWIRLPAKGLSIENMLDIYRKKHGKLSLKSAMTQYFYSLMYDPKKDTISLQKMFHQLKDLHEQGILTKKEFDSFKNLSYENTPLHLYMPYDNLFRRVANDYFKLEKIHFPKLPGMNKLPLYVMRKK